MIKKRFMPDCFSADDKLQVMGSAQEGAIGPRVNCLVWNILKARRNRWMEDFLHLSADRDIVLLQEAVFNAPTDKLFTQHQRLEWIMARSYKDPLSQVEHGVKTGSMTKALQSQVYVSPHHEPVSQTPKLLLTSVYPIAHSAEQLLVLNMHAINFVGVRKYEGQLDQLTQALADHNGPVILGGDFNTWSPARLARFFKVAEDAGLREASMTRKKKLVHMNRNLDHLFYRGFKLLSVNSLNEYRSSDHAPIIATLELT